MKTIHTLIFKTALFSMAVLFVLSTSCRREETKAVILIKSAGLQFPVKLMMIDSSGPRAIDSLMKPSAKDFKFVISVSELSAFILHSSNYKTGFLLSAGDTAIIDATKPFNNQVEDNKSYGFREYQHTMELFDEQADSLSDLFITAQVTDSFAVVREKVNKAFNNLMLDARTYATRFIYDNPESILVFIAINSTLKQTPLFNYSVTPEIFHFADSVMQKNNPGHRYSVWLHKKVLMLKKTYGGVEKGVIRIHEGDILPLVKLPGLRNQMLKLEPLKGKITIVYLWNESPQSRKATIRVKMLNEEYKSQGLETYAIAFTVDRRKWTSIIELDKMWWNNMIDTSASGSPLLKDFNIRRLPYFIIIDENRQVLRHFASAEAMEEWLDLYFKNRK